jgi:hypothetical protein
MAQQGISPAHDLLQAHAGQLNRITLPAHLIHAGHAAASAADVGNTQQLLYSLSLTAQPASAAADSWPQPSGSSGGGHTAKAAACMAAASEAVEVCKHKELQKHGTLLTELLCVITQYRVAPLSVARLRCAKRSVMVTDAVVWLA